MIIHLRSEWFRRRWQLFRENMGHFGTPWVGTSLIRHASRITEGSWIRNLNKNWRRNPLEFEIIFEFGNILSVNGFDQERKICINKLKLSREKQTLKSLLFFLGLKIMIKKKCWEISKNYLCKIIIMIIIIIILYYSTCLEAQVLGS